MTISVTSTVTSTVTIAVTIKRIFRRNCLCFSFEHHGTDAYCFLDVVNRGDIRLRPGARIELEGQWAAVPAVFEAVRVRGVPTAGLAQSGPRRSLQYPTRGGF